MKRPDRLDETRRGLFLALAYATSLLRSPRRLLSAFGKAASLLRTAGPSGVWHTVRAKLHWGSTPYAAWVKIFDTLATRKSVPGCVIG